MQPSASDATAERVRDGTDENFTIRPLAALVNTENATSFLGAVPGLMTRGAVLVEQLDVITRDGLVLAPETVAAIGQAEARRGRWTTIALWVIAALLIWIVWLIA